MKINLVLLISMMVLSCSSPFKKKSDTFVSDSAFLKQGHKIEDYVDEAAKKEMKKEEKKESRAVKGKVATVKTNLLKNRRAAPKEKAKETPISQKNKKIEILKKNEAPKLPFRVGEEVTLAATFFGVEAGKILIGVDNFKKFEGKKQYHFYAFGKTSSIFSLFYKVRNKIESLWDPEIKQPRSLAFDVRESKQKYKIRVYLDWLKKRGEHLEEGWDNKKGDYKVQKKWTLTDGAQDVVSGAFYMRMFPFEVGKEYKLSIMEEDKIIDVHLKVDRKELLKTRVGKFKTLVLKPRFSVKGKFKQVGEISVWLTDDSYRQVVRIEMKIKLGTIVAKLHSIKRP